MFVQLARRKPALHSLKIKCLVVHSAVLLQVYLHDSEDIFLKYLGFLKFSITVTLYCHLICAK